MALTSNQYSVDGTAVLICDQSPSGVRVTIHNTDQGNALYVNGGSSVSTVTGYRIDAKDKLQLTLNPAEQLWAICSTGQTVVVAVLKQTQYA
jgi:hypothetical protein